MGISKIRGLARGLQASGRARVGPGFWSRFVPSAAAISSEGSVALSRGAPPRPQPFMAQADAQPFAALLDAAVAPVADRGTGATAASAQSSEQKPAADTAAADTGAAAPDRAAGAPTPSAGNAVQGAAAPANSAAPQSVSAGATQGAAADQADNGKPVAVPGANDSITLISTASADGTPIQTTHGDGTHHQTAAKNGVTANANQPVIAMPLPTPSAGGGGPNPSSASANAARDANDPAAQDAADAGKNAANDTAAAAVAASIAELSGSGSAGGVTPVPTKPGTDGNDGDKDQQSDSTDAATVSPVASGPQLPSPDGAQPVAAAMVVNAAPDPVPAAAAKPGLTIADAVKGRAKVTVASVATEQTTPTQDDTTDAPGSSSADSGAANASPGPDDASASNLQQAIDQAPAPGANGTAILSQIDFASFGGTEHFGLRGDAATSPNGAAASAAPNGTANAAMAPNFGIFAPGAIAANGAAPAAATPEPAVPLAGLAVAIAGRAQAGSSQFDIRLDPPELGRIDVRLDVDGSGQVRTHVTADRADTLQLLQSQQPQLERALEQAGLKTADNGLQFTLRDQSFTGQDGGSGGQQQATPPMQPVIPDSDTAPINTAQIYARLRFGNGLDIRV